LRFKNIIKHYSSKRLKNNRFKSKEKYSTRKRNIFAHYVIDLFRKKKRKEKLALHLLLEKIDSLENSLFFNEKC